MTPQDLRPWLLLSMLFGLMTAYDGVGERKVAKTALGLCCTLASVGIIMVLEPWR